MIINAFKDKIFPFGVGDPEDLGQRPDENNESGESHESDEGNEFYSPKETPRDIVPDLETEESAAQRRKTKGQGLKILTPQ